MSIADGDTFTVANSATPGGQVFELASESLSVQAGSDFADGDLLEIIDPAGVMQTFEFEGASQNVTDPTYAKITFSVTDSPGQIEADIATAINNVYYNTDPTTLQAIALPYSGGGTSTSSLSQWPCGTVALANFAGYTIVQPTPPGVVVVGGTAVPAGDVEIDYTAADTPDQVALEIQKAIVNSGLNTRPAWRWTAGNVYIADAGNNAIKEWNAATQTVTTLGLFGAE